MKTNETKSIVKNAAFNIMYKLLNVVFPLISTAYISRIIKPDGVGKVAYAQNIVSYFVLIASIGIPSYGVREIARRNHSVDDRSRTFCELMLLNSVSTSICVATYFGMISIVPGFRDDLKLYMITGLLLIFNYINIDWFYQGMEEYQYIALRSAAIKILSLFLLFVFVKNQNDYRKYALIVCLATGGNYIFNIVHCKKFVDFNLHDLKLKRHIRPVLYLLVCTISTELYSKIDITMLGSLHSDSIVGYYSNAQKTINIIITFAMAITAVFLPRLSLLYKENRTKFNFLVNKGTHIVLLVSLPCMLGVIFVAPEIVEILFGNDFLPAVNTIRVLAPLILIKGMGDLLTYQVIISSGNEKKLVKAYIAAAISNICLNAMFIPRYAQNGAAVASVFGELVVFVVLIPTTFKVVKIDISRKSMISIIEACGIMSLTLIFVEVLPVTNSISRLLLKVMIGCLVYFGVLIHKKDSIVINAINAIKRKEVENDV